MPTARVNGISMYYELHGSGEPLVLIAGLSTDLTQHDGIIRGLSPYWQVIAFDNRGVGRTDRPDSPYSLEMMADDTAGLLALLGVRRAHVVGISMGGQIAIALALRQPALVRTLVLASTCARRPPPSVRRRLLFSLQRVPRVREIGTEYPQPYYAFVRQRDASRGFDATSRLHDIHAPTLVLHGRRDRVIPYSLAEKLHSGIEGSEMVTFDAGHLFMLRQQQKFLEAVMAFLTAKKDEA